MNHPGKPSFVRETFPSGRGKIDVRASITEKTTVGVVFLPWHFAEATTFDTEIIKEYIKTMVR